MKNLIWRDGDWVREDNRPEAPAVTAKEKRELLEEVRKELKAAAIERGATKKQAEEGARFYLGQFRVHSSPVGVTVQAFGHGLWGGLQWRDAVRSLAHRIVVEANEEETPFQPPTAAEVYQKARQEQNRGLAF